MRSRPCPPPPPCHRRGISLLETQIAFVVLGLGLAGLCPIVTMHYRQLAILEGNFNSSDRGIREENPNGQRGRLQAFSSVYYRPDMARKDVKPVNSGQVHYIIPWNNPWARKLTSRARVVPEQLRSVVATEAPTPLPKGCDLQLMSWGDGSSVKTSGEFLVIAGIDTDGLLHIRTFDRAGVRTDTYEATDGGAPHLLTADISGHVLSDAPEASLPAALAEAIASLKQQVPRLLPPHSLSDDEKNQVLAEATLVSGYTPKNLFVTLKELKRSDDGSGWQATVELDTSP